MNSAAFFCRRDALDTVHSCFIFKNSKDIMSADFYYEFIKLLYLESFFLRKTDLHTKEFLCPELGFIAACSAFDFKNDIALIKAFLSFFLRAFYALFDLLLLFFKGCDFLCSHLNEGRVIKERFCLLN